MSLLKFIALLNIRINTSYIAHFKLATLIGVWLVLFLVFIGPFDGADLTLKIRAILMPPYGVIFAASYLSIIPLQNWLFRKQKRWNLGYELLMIGLAYCVAMFSVYLYYKSSFINGDYSFAKFLGEIYLPTLIILSTILFFGRWFIARKKEEIIVKEKEIIIQKVPVQPQKMILKGDNKSDVLQMLPEDLICISSAQNYVEIHYLNNQILQKKLLRTTLKKIAQQTPNLIQVHRSHFINPIHFVEWSDAHSITLYQLTIPVSQNYKKTLLSSI